MSRHLQALGSDDVELEVRQNLLDFSQARAAKFLQKTEVHHLQWVSMIDSIPYLQAWNCCAWVLSQKNTDNVPAQDDDRAEDCT